MMRQVVSSRAYLHDGSRSRVPPEREHELNEPDTLNEPNEVRA